MKKLLIAAAMVGLMSSTAFAGAKIGVSMAKFDDNFLTVLRNGMIAQAKGMSGVELQVEDAQNDVAKQLDQIKNFAAIKVDAIIVNPVDTSATQAMTEPPPPPRSRWSTSIASRSMSTRCPTTRPSSPRTKPIPARSKPRRVCRLFKEAGKKEANVYVIDGRAFQPGRRAAHQGH